MLLAPVVISSFIPFVKVQPDLGEAETREGWRQHLFYYCGDYGKTASSRLPVWPLTEQTGPDSQPWACADQRYSSKSQGSAVQPTWQCAPRAPQVQSGNQTSPFQRVPQVRRSPAHHLQAGTEGKLARGKGGYFPFRNRAVLRQLCPSSPAATNHPLPSPWGKCRQRKIWHMEISALKSNIISKLMTNKIYFCSGLV